MHVGERMVRLDDDGLTLNPTLPAVDVHDDVYAYDFVPLALPAVDGHELSLSLYALPGHPAAYEAIDRMWRGIDVLVFVADSRPGAMAANVDSWRRYEANPWFSPSTEVVMLANRRDADDAVAAEELAGSIGWTGSVFESVASRGVGMEEAMGVVVDAVTRRARERVASAQ